MTRNFLEPHPGDAHACQGRLVVGFVGAYLVIAWLAPVVWRFILGFLEAM